VKVIPMTGHKVVLLVILVGCFSLPRLTGAQTLTSGTIAGVVKDATGAVLPGVTVEASSPALIERARMVTTDGQGEYKIVDLRPGTYAVTFDLSGFAKVKREGIELTTGFTATVNAEMKVGSVAETVTVSGASPVVDVQNVRSENVLTRDILDTIPTGKTIQGYAALTLGVTVLNAAQDVGGNGGEAAVSLMIHGNRTADQHLFLDGMPYNDQLSTGGGYLRIYMVNQLANQEVTIETSGMAADTETGGVQINAVPKDGSNTFSGTVNLNGTGNALQSGNLDDMLRARGLTSAASVKKIYDNGFGLGGRIISDRLWFYTAFRWWGNQEYAAGNYFDATPHTLFYTPDLSRPAYNDIYSTDQSARLTWQAAPKHKFTFLESVQENCNCFYQVDVNRAPEAVSAQVYGPVSMTQATWTFAATSRLLFEGGFTYSQQGWSPSRAPGTTNTDIPVTELSTGYLYNAASGITYSTATNHIGQGNVRLSASYITGSHAFKVGMFLARGQSVRPIEANGNPPVSYSFLNGKPSSLTEWASPSFADSRVQPFALYGQDQWTMKRLTLNLGLRFDQLREWDPAQTRPAGYFVEAFTFPELNNVPNWKDLNPRLGASYDLFGHGKTVVKAALGRYVIAEATSISSAVNPANSIVTSATRVWNDSNNNFVPDCNLQNPVANGECGALSNAAFGTQVINTTYDPGVLNGFEVRPYTWQASAAVQHELRPGVGLSLGYFRTSYGNFLVTANQAVTSANYNSYCITVPGDSRLPGAGGNQLCGLYDLNPAQFGRVNNLVTEAANYGGQTEVYNGLDVAITARFHQGGLLSGGLSTGRTVANDCAIATRFPQVAATNTLTFGGALGSTVGSGPSTSTQFCQITFPFSAQTQLKLAAIVPLPWSLQASAVLQNLPGIPYNTSYVATNAQIAPSLGRNLGACGASAACAATATITELYAPDTLFERRLTQLDLRLAKILKVGRLRVQGRFDIYNVLNANNVLADKTTYGSAWLTPTTIMDGRLVKFGAQLDF
jgi:hypothetical protein